MAVLTMSSSHFLTTILAFALAFASHASSPPSLAEATNSEGFSLELIHRDSPKSPLYNASETPSQRLAKSLLRSRRRVQHFSSVINGDGGNPDDTVEYDFPGETGYDYSGEYLVKIGFGTPPVETHLILDTLSILIWTQCKGCTNCFPLDTPAYDPSATSTHDTIACFAHSCNSFQNTCTDDLCRYTLYYGDGSTYTMGVLFSEYLTVTSTDGELLTFNNVVFGCGYDNQVFFSGKVSGVLGMGNGMTSLAHQLQYRTGPKFSYCFTPSRDVPGKINLGLASSITGPTVVSTPLILEESDRLYRFSLKAVTIGTTRIELGKFSTVGNMVIDSGSVPTLLPTVVYRSLENEVKRIINESELAPPFGESLAQLCYPAKVDLPYARLIMHLDGSDLHLKLADMFMRDSAGISCFSFGPSENQNIFFYGNWAQSNFWVGFDVDAKTLSFRPSDCTTPS